MGREEVHSPAMVKKMTLESILAQNLTELMAERPGLDTIDKVATRAGVGRGTVDRLKKAEVSAKLETVEMLAIAFGVPPTRLLMLPDQDQQLPAIHNQTAPPGPSGSLETTASHALQWISHDESELLEKFRRLDPSDRRNMQEWADLLLVRATASAANKL